MSSIPTRIVLNLDMTATPKSVDAQVAMVKATLEKLKAAGIDASAPAVSYGGGIRTGAPMGPHEFYYLKLSRKKFIRVKKGMDREKRAEQLLRMEFGKDEVAKAKAEFAKAPDSAKMREAADESEEDAPVDESSLL